MSYENWKNPCLLRSGEYRPKKIPNCWPTIMGHSNITISMYRYHSTFSLKVLDQIWAQKSWIRAQNLFSQSNNSLISCFSSDLIVMWYSIHGWKWEHSSLSKCLKFPHLDHFFGVNRTSSHFRPMWVWIWLDVASVK